MKFTLACLALTANLTGAFAPQTAYARSTSLNSAVQSPTYTFTKSEEIFKEAQEVGVQIGRRCRAPILRETKEFFYLVRQHLEL